MVLWLTGVRSICGAFLVVLSDMSEMQVLSFRKRPYLSQIRYGGQIQPPRTVVRTSIVKMLAPSSMKAMLSDPGLLVLLVFPGVCLSQAQLPSWTFTSSRKIATIIGVHSDSLSCGPRFTLVDTGIKYLFLRACPFLWLVGSDLSSPHHA